MQHRSMYPGESRYHFEEQESIVEYNRGLDAGRVLANQRPGMSVDELHTHVDALPIPPELAEFDDYFRQGYAYGVFWGYRHEAKI